MDEGMNLQGINYNVSNTVPINDRQEPVIETSEPIEDNTVVQTNDNLIVENANYLHNDNLFSNIDFGPLQKYLTDDNITDISYSNGGQVWILKKSLFSVLMLWVKLLIWLILFWIVNLLN